MATYEITLPDGSVFEVNMPEGVETSGFERPVTGQLSQEPAAASAPDGYLDRINRRAGEYLEAGLSTPRSALNIVTGGDPRGRLAAAFKTLQGLGTPINMLLSPVEAAVEQASEAAGVSKEASRTIGDVSSLPLTLGVGLLAKAGKLSKFGQRLAKAVSGVGSTEDILRTDPQFRYAATAVIPGEVPPKGKLSVMPPAALLSPIEELTRIPEVSAAELAMAAKSPTTARVMLEKYRAATDEWREFAKQNHIIEDMPPAPNFTWKDVMEFQVAKPYDLGVFGTLGTPTSRAAAIHPKGAAVAYDLALTEMGIRKGVDARVLRNEREIMGIGDKDLSQAIKWRNVRTIDEILESPNINPNVKKVAKFIEDKWSADREVIIPHLRNTAGERIRAQLLRSEKEKPHGLRMDPQTFEKTVRDKAEKMYPSTMSIEEMMQEVFPTYYRIYDKSGKFYGSANSRAEAKAKIFDIASEGGISAANFKLKHRAIFDADTLHIFQGRVSRLMEQVAQKQGLTPEEIEAATRGDFSLHAPSKFFSQFLGRDYKGYRKDLLNALSFYDRTVEKFLAIGQFESRAKPVMKELSERGYRQLVDMLYTSLNSLKGRRSALGELVDNTIAATPVLNTLVSPYALERLVGGAKGGIINTFLRWNPRFHILNATQLSQTLLPIADMRELNQARKLWMSPEGTSLLQKHGIKGIGTRLEEFTKSLGPSERMNQEVAFLAMYNRARQLGLDDSRAAIYGKLRGNLHSQFVGLTMDVPKAFRKIDPLGVMFMFQRFPIKNFELLLDLVKNRQYSGAAKWTAVNLLMGGVKAATLGEAGWLTQDLYNKLEKEFGKPVADVMHVGLPALAGVDMSNSVMFYNPPFGDNWYERVGRLLGGPMGSVLSGATGAAAFTAGPEPEAAKRAFDGLVNSIPLGRQVLALEKLLTGDHDLKDPAGRLKYKADWSDLLKKILGFRPLREANVDTAVTAMMEVTEARNGVINFAASRYGQSQAAGIPLGEEMEKMVRQEVDAWNNMFPEFPITGDELVSRTKARVEAATKDLRERVMKNLPKVIREKYRQPILPGGG